MKHIKIFGLLMLAVIALISCTKDDDFKFTAQEPASGISFTNSFLEKYTLTPSTSDNLGERFTWNSADYGVPTLVNYKLQKSITGDFTDAEDIGETNGNELAVTIGQLLSYATELGLDNDPNTEAPDTGVVSFRLKASVGTDALEVFSTIQELTLYLPQAADETPIELPKLFVVGSYLEASGYGSNWTPSDAVPIAASADGKTDYEGFIYIKDDSSQFKFLPTNESFDGDYGDTGDSDGSYSETIEQEGEVNCGTPDGTGGYYWVKADTDALTYSLTKTDWGIIGNATPTGWDSDTNMVYDPDTKIWSLTLDLIKQDAPDNGIKFRANDGWDINLGDTDADGTMEFGGQNIGVPEDGNYTITLDLSNPRMYTYTLTKN